MPRDLVDGLYEHVVTGTLAHDLAALDPLRGREVTGLDPASAHEALAQHLIVEVQGALASVPISERPKIQVEIVNQLLEVLRSLVPGLDESIEDSRVEPPGQELRAVFRGARPVRPTTPLTSSTLLTRNRADPSLGAELAREIASADRIDALVAFITVGGVRALSGALESFARRGGGERLRMLTTVFTGTTEPSAVESLARLPGARVKISYDTRRTRLHAKAWLFQDCSDSTLTTRISAPFGRYVN